MDSGRGSCRDADVDVDVDVDVGEDSADGPYTHGSHHDEDEASYRIRRFLCDAQAPLYRLHLALPSASNHMATLAFVAEAFPQVPAEEPTADARRGANHPQSRAAGPADGRGIDGPHMSTTEPVDWQCAGGNAEQQAAIWGELFVIPDGPDGGPLAVDDAAPGPLGTWEWHPEGAGAQFDLFEEQEEKGRSTTQGSVDGVCHGSADGRDWAKCKGGRWEGLLRRM